jgi:hypothetical protein
MLMLRANNISGDRMDIHKCARLPYARRVELACSVVEGRAHSIGGCSPR